MNETSEFLTGFEEKKRLPSNAIIHIDELDKSKTYHFYIYDPNHILNISGKPIQDLGVGNYRYHELHTADLNRWESDLAKFIDIDDSKIIVALPKYFGNYDNNAGRYIDNLYKKTYWKEGGNSYYLTYAVPSWKNWAASIFLGGAKSPENTAKNAPIPGDANRAEIIENKVRVFFDIKIHEMSAFRPSIGLVCLVGLVCLLSAFRPSRNTPNTPLISAPTISQYSCRPRFS
jgi:hypothetical protein